MSRNFIIVFSVLALLITGGCASSQPKVEKVDRMAVLEAQIARIVAELSELQRLSRDNSRSVQALRDDLLGRLDALRTDDAKASVMLDGLEARVSAFGERTEDSELRINELRQEVNSLRLGRFRNPIVVPEETYEENEGTDGEEITSPLDPSSSRDDTASFQKAYGDFLRSEFNLAVGGFRNFLILFPDSYRADDAQFYLAECFFELGDFETAVEEFDNVILRYPDSTYYVGATYKKALSFLESNQTAQGVILLQQLIRRYPDSNEARLAREKLKNMGLIP